MSLSVHLPQEFDQLTPFSSVYAGFCNHFNIGAVMEKGVRFIGNVSRFKSKWLQNGSHKITGTSSRAQVLGGDFERLPRARQNRSHLTHRDAPDRNQRCRGMLQTFRRAQGRHRQGLCRDQVFLATFVRVFPLHAPRGPLTRTQENMLTGESSAGAPKLTSFEK